MVNLNSPKEILLARMLVSHAYREQLAAQRFTEALSLLPEGESESYWLHVITEEEEHYRGCLRVAAELGIDLPPLVQARMLRNPPGIPPFKTWLDVLMAHAFNDKAGYFVLLGIIDSTVAPYAELAREIVAEEESHGSHGVAALFKYYPVCELCEHSKRAILTQHVEASIRCLGRPFTPGDCEAVRLGLKTKPAAKTVNDFCAYVGGVLEGIGCGGLLPTLPRHPEDCAA
jgi:hypothetical protein